MRPNDYVQLARIDDDCLGLWRGGQPLFSFHARPLALCEYFLAPKPSADRLMLETRVRGNMNAQLQKSLLLVKSHDVRCLAWVRAQSVLMVLALLRTALHAFASVAWRDQCHKETPLPGVPQFHLAGLPPQDAGEPDTPHVGRGAMT